VISIQFINSFCNRFLCKFNLRKLLAKFLLEGLRFVLEIFEIFVVEIFVVEIFWEVFLCSFPVSGCLLSKLHYFGTFENFYLFWYYLLECGNWIYAFQNKLNFDLNWNNFKFFCGYDFFLVFKIINFLIRLRMSFNYFFLLTYLFSFCPRSTILSSYCLYSIRVVSGIKLEN